MWDFTEEEIFDYANKNKLLGIEFWSQQIEDRNLSTKKLRDLSKKFNLDLTLHAKSWDLNLASINERIREVSLKEILDDVNLARNIGAKEITIHPGRFSVSYNKEIYYKFLKESLNTILDYSTKKNINISIEVMEKIKNEFIIDLKSLKKLMGDNYEDFKYTLDISHCDSLEEIYFNLNNIKNISKCHISNRFKDKYHTELEKGIFPMEEIIFKIGEKNIPMVIEGMEIGRNNIVLDKNIRYLKEKNLL
ncbi:endonuclease IV [Peptoniphilus harei]|uniref:sugar phosphate isomerase/epimerase family protein n=1 Tax=Peptoniphilus harei TaxID=54005 RepID=UPI000F6B9FB5|nr:sugar phosphate isomerase/epimerase family protein [Peptoniphilus harei]QQE47127.1 sugar phosphate isomerase/epimerase [Peptoniphilus harei]VEJ34506.1 endonuclease IV [Peptoniphilus harei]